MCETSQSFAAHGSTERFKSSHLDEELQWITGTGKLVLKLLNK